MEQQGWDGIIPENSRGLAMAFNLHFKMKFRNECPSENGTKGAESEMIEKGNKTLFLNMTQP